MPRLKFSLSENVNYGRSAVIILLLIKKSTEPVSKMNFQEYTIAPSDILKLERNDI